MMRVDWGGKTAVISAASSWIGAASALRLSLGPEVAEADAMRFAEAWVAARERFRARAA